MEENSGYVIGGGFSGGVQPEPEASRKQLKLLTKFKKLPKGVSRAPFRAFNTFKHGGVGVLDKAQDLLLANKVVFRALCALFFAPAITYGALTTVVYAQASGLAAGFVVFLLVLALVFASLEGYRYAANHQDRWQAALPARKPGGQSSV